jgi:hypothetical protein
LLGLSVHAIYLERWRTYILDTLLQDGEEEAGIATSTTSSLLRSTLPWWRLVLRRLLTILLGRKS